MKAQTLIERFGLVAHPEGGYYRESYRSDGIIPPSGLPEPFTGSRHFSTAIYFLLEQGQYSRLHRIRSDEIWHFYLGGPLRLAMIHPDGKTDKIILGQDIAAGQTLQYVGSRRRLVRCDALCGNGFFIRRVYCRARLRFRRF